MNQEIDAQAQFEEEREVVEKINRFSGLYLASLRDPKETDGVFDPESVNLAAALDELILALRELKQVQA